ncbi:unnamed protein product, partial [marine sediment metagenome]
MGSDAARHAYGPIGPALKKLMIEGMGWLLDLCPPPEE